jgi:putative transposase
MENTNLISCRYCGSSNVKRFGTYKETQLWWCKDCKRKFRESTALFKMKTPVEQVSGAMDMYYGGLPLDSIQRNIEQQYGNRLADETVVRIGGRNVWFWDIIDRDSRYLLASHISRTRTIKDAQALMQEAYERAGKAPKKILTDKLAAYIDGIELTFGSDTRHVQTNPFVGGDETTNIIERFHGTLKERTKIIRWFGNVETAKILTNGWLCHYNFCKEHTSLGDVPPAQKTGGKVPFTNWSEVVTGKPLMRVSEADFTRMERGAPVVHDSVKPRRVRRRKPEILKHKTYHEASLARLRP